MRLCDVIDESSGESSGVVTFTVLYIGEAPAQYIYTVLHA